MKIKPISFFTALAAVAITALPMFAVGANVWSDAYVKICGAVDLNGDGKWTPADNVYEHLGISATAEIPDVLHGALQSSPSQNLRYGSSNSSVISRAAVQIINKDVVLTSCGGKVVNMPVLYFPQPKNGNGYDFENLYFNNAKSPFIGSKEWTVLLRCRLEEFIGTLSYIFGVKTTNLGGQKEIRLGFGNNPWNTSDPNKYLNVVLGNTRRGLTNIPAKTGKWVELSMSVHPSAPVDVDGVLTITNAIRFSCAYEGEMRLWRDLEVPYNHTSYTTNFVPTAGSTCFGGIRYGTLPNNFDAFRGDIQMLGLWNRALSDKEVCEAFGEGYPDVFRLGEEGRTAEMYGGEVPASGATVTLDPLTHDKRAFPTAFSTGSTYRIPFTVDKYSAGLAHWLHFKAQSGSATGQIAVAIDGESTGDAIGVHTGNDGYAWISGEKFTVGDHVLTLTRVDNGDGAVKFDVIELGGALSAGVFDNSEADLASAGTADNIKKNGDYFDYNTWYAGSGHLLDFVRNVARSNTGVHRPTRIVLDMPSGSEDKFGMRFSYKFLYSTADAGGNEPLAFTVNGTQVYLDTNASAQKKTATSFEIKAEDSPFHDGENEILIDFVSANKNNWADWDFLAIEPLRPKSSFLMVIR